MQCQVIINKFQTLSCVAQLCILKINENTYISDKKMRQKLQCSISLFRLPVFLYCLCVHVRTSHRTASASSLQPPNCVCCWAGTELAVDCCWFVSFLMSLVYSFWHLRKTATKTTNLSPLKQTFGPMPRTGEVQRCAKCCVVVMRLEANTRGVV